MSGMFAHTTRDTLAASLTCWFPILPQSRHRQAKQGCKPVNSFPEWGKILHEKCQGARLAREYLPPNALEQACKRHGLASLQSCILRESIMHPTTNIPRAKAHTQKTNQWQGPPKLTTAPKFWGRLGTKTLNHRKSLADWNKLAVAQKGSDFKACRRHDNGHSAVHTVTAAVCRERCIFDFSLYHDRHSKRN